MARIFRTRGTRVAGTGPDPVPPLTQPPAQGPAATQPATTEPADFRSPTTQSAPTDTTRPEGPASDTTRPEGPASESRPPTTAPVPRTRTGAAWVGVCAAAVITVALIIFLAQNTSSVQISFLWMTTSTSLAIALLIAAVSGILVTLILGTARIAQLRRNLRRRSR